MELGLLRVKILCKVVLLESVKTDSERIDLSRKKWSCPLRGEEYDPFLAVNHYEHQKNVRMGKGRHQDLLP